MKKLNNNVIIGVVVLSLSFGGIVYGSTYGTLGSLFVDIGSQNYKLIGDNIQDGTIDSSEIEDNTLTSSDLAQNSVGNSELINTESYTMDSLQIDSKITIGTLSATGNLEVNGNILADNISFRSDKRLKYNIVNINSSLEKINRLNGYTYNWKETGKSDIGVIAQEVEKEFPDLVLTNKETGYKSVKYANLIAPIIESIKELFINNKKLEQEIELLREEIKKMKNNK